MNYLRLSSEAEQLLLEILEHEEEPNYWRKRFDSATRREDSILRGCFGELKGAKMISVRWADNFPYTVENIKSYIAAHIQEDLSVASLSAMSHYNGDYLTRIFRQTTGFTLSQYIASCRMDEIRRLLQTTRMSLNDIVACMFFSSRSYFNRFIKRETGKTPQELLLELRGGK